MPSSSKPYAARPAPMPKQRAGFDADLAGASRGLDRRVGRADDLGIAAHPPQQARPAWSGAARSRSRGSRSQPTRAHGRRPPGRRLGRRAPRGTRRACPFAAPRLRRGFGRGHPTRSRPPSGRGPPRVGRCRHSMRRPPHCRRAMRDRCPSPPRGRRRGSRAEWRARNARAPRHGRTRPQPHGPPEPTHRSRVDRRVRRASGRRARRSTLRPRPRQPGRGS